MLHILLIRPGSTDFDEQGRIKGILDVPLNENGTQQVARTILELADSAIDVIYTSPCESCRQTAEAIGKQRELKVKRLDGLKNLDHGLWHGKLIDEVRRNQPRVYRQLQSRPETVCPPQGESLHSAQERVDAVLAKLTRKHRRGVVALIVPEPLASLFRASLNKADVGDLWKVQCQCGGWEQYPVGTMNTAAIPDQA